KAKAGCAKAKAVRHSEISRPVSGDDDPRIHPDRARRTPNIRRYLMNTSRNYLVHSPSTRISHLNRCSDLEATFQATARPLDRLGSCDRGPDNPRIPHPHHWQSGGRVGPSIGRCWDLRNGGFGNLHVNAIEPPFQRTASYRHWTASLASQLLHCYCPLSLTVRASLNLTSRYTFSDLTFEPVEGMHHLLCNIHSRRFNPGLVFDPFENLVSLSNVCACKAEDRAVL